MVSILKAAHLD